jgi:hypothetical protein
MMAIAPVVTRDPWQIVGISHPPKRLQSAFSPQVVKRRGR